jgi:hypothetical protein
MSGSQVGHDHLSHCKTDAFPGGNLRKPSELGGIAASDARRPADQTADIPQGAEAST